MDTDNAVTFLRSLKGAPISVLIAIRIFPGPASLLQLAGATGYDQHTCARATQALEAMGYLERAHYRGWQLTGTAQQLPLWTPSEIEGITPDRPRLLDAPKRAKCAFQEPEALPLFAGALDAAPGPALKRANCAFQEMGLDEDAAGAALKRANCAFQEIDLDGDSPGPELKRANCAFQEIGLDEDSPGPELKRANCAFQELGLDEDSPGPELKRANCAFQELGLDEDPGLKRANCAFQEADPGGPAVSAAPPAAEDAPKRANYAFQDDDDSLKRAFCAFQPADGGSGSGGLINTNTRVDLKPPPPPRPSELAEPKRAFCAFQPDETDLLQDLIDLTGCPRRRAETAVRKARDAGYFTPWLHLQVLRWHAYIADGRGSNLHNPGYFVARKLEDGEACPSEQVRPQHDAQARQLTYQWDHVDEEAAHAAAL